MMDCDTVTVNMILCCVEHDHAQIFRSESIETMALNMENGILYHESLQRKQCLGHFEGDVRLPFSYL